MKGKLIFKLGALTTILSVLLVVPALGQTAQTNEALGKQLKDYKANILKELKIAPDKEKALMAVEDKYSLHARRNRRQLRRRLGMICRPR